MEKNEKLNASAFKSHSSSLEKQKNSVSESNKTTNQTNGALKTSSNAEGKDLQKIRDLILSKKSTSSSADNEKANQSKFNQSPNLI
jgi:hypothetical protein